MDRVMVIGGPGSGKTWLAKELARCTGLPVIAIDDLVHDAAGQQRPPARIDADARAAADSSRWIIEGGNSRTYDYRAQRANCIVLLQPRSMEAPMARVAARRLEPAPACLDLAL